MTMILIVFVNVVLLVSGQVCWKIALSRQPIKSFDGLLSLFQQPIMLLGCLLFGLATIIWFYALGKYELSRIYPLQSFAYVFGALAGIVIFKEAVSVYQLLGLVLIVGGAFLIVKT